MTLRGLFVLVAILAVACAALKFGGFWASVLFGIALLIVARMAIVAVVGRGSGQAFAIGFILVAIIYAATFLVTNVTTGGSELNPFGICYLPTTKSLGPPYTLIAQRTYIDFETKKEIANYDPSKAGATAGGMAGGLLVTMNEFPEHRTFMLVGHVLWTLLFAYVGGYFARRTYAQYQTSGSRSV